MFRIQTIAEANPSDPFEARLLLGILDLRAKALQFDRSRSDSELARMEFDESYDPVWKALRATRTSVMNINRAIGDHIQKLSIESIVQFQSGAYSVSESIDKLLRDEMASFLMNSVVAIKGTQRVMKWFGINIGCLFVKPVNFERGVDVLRLEGHKALAQFLGEVRANWSEDVIHRRDSQEHSGWNLPSVEYRVVGSNKVEMIEPEIDRVPVRHFCMVTFNRISSFVEGVIAYGCKQLLHEPVVIVEIPRDQRDETCPVRFRLDLKRSGVEEWEICYSDSAYP